MENSLVEKLKMFIDKVNKDINDIDDFYLEILKQRHAMPSSRPGTLLMPKPHYRYNWKTQQAERVK